MNTETLLSGDKASAVTTAMRTVQCKKVEMLDTGGEVEHQELWSSLWRIQKAMDTLRDKLEHSDKSEHKLVYLASWYFPKDKFFHTVIPGYLQQPHP